MSGSVGKKLVFLVAGKKPVLLVAALNLAFGCVSVIALRHSMPAASALFTVAYLANEAVIAVLCLAHARRSPHLKAHWLLFAVGSSWQLLVAIVSLVGKSVNFVADPTTILLFCGFIPPLLLISLPAGRRYFQHFFWIDLAQALFASYVGYAIIFQARPFTRDLPIGLGGPRLFHLFLAAQVVIVAGAFLHIIAAPNCDERRFFRVFFLVRLISMAGSLIHNLFLIRDPADTLTGIPILVADFIGILLVLTSASETIDTSPDQSQGRLADVINLASPALPSAALLTLGGIVESRFPGLGRAAMATAFTLFVIRVTFYQRSFEIMQRDLRSAQVRLEHLSYTDTLTGLANRRALEIALDAEFERSARTGAPLSLLLIDVDYFKAVNDEHGHRTGDEYLIAIATALSTTLHRASDVVGRYGGDEFAVILPEANRATAENIAEKLCVAVRALDVKNAATVTGAATISIGIATRDTLADLNPRSLLSAADSALYDIKNFGRNGWCSYGADVGFRRSSTVPPSSPHDAGSRQR